MTVKNLLRHLGNREKQIIKRFYGINTKEEELSTIGDYLGLTRERARQIKEKTVRHLRDMLYKRKGMADKIFVAQEEDEKDFSDGDASKMLQPSLSINEEKHEEKEVMVGDIIVYDSKLCTVVEKKNMKGYIRLVVKYEDGTIDNLRNDGNRYKIVNCHDEDDYKEFKNERKKRSKFHMSTPLDFLVEENILTRRQLHQCHKKKLRTIGDVKQIIEKYQLTPYSTRFTKYTLDMWFSIISLLNKSE